MFVVTHLKTNYPQEHHVFINLSHSLDLLVMAPKVDLAYILSKGKIKEVPKP